MAHPPSRGRSSGTGLGRLQPLRTGDFLWGLAIAFVVGYLLLRNFVWGSGGFSTVRLGPLELSVFGLLAALDMLFGVYLAHRWCEAFELDWETLARGLPWIILLGYYASHLVSVALYFPEDLTDPRALLDPRTRISSFGGILGGGLIALLYFRRKGLPIRRYVDVLTLGFVGGYVFGRAGCFAIHDHPGLESDFVLAVDIAGQRRHDLGFYEMILMLSLLVGIFLLAWHGRPRDGRVFAFVAIAYAPVRFLFDSLRVIDVRYASLTPGQWFSIPMLALGVWSAWTARRPETDAE